MSRSILGVFLSLTLTLILRSEDGAPPSANEVILPPVETLVPSLMEEVRAIKVSASYPSFDPRWRDQIDIVYLPDTGYAWTAGVAYEARVALLGDRMLGFWYQPGGNERLLVLDSTNRYEANLKDASPVVKAELERFKAGRGRFSGDPSYFMRVEELLGPAVLRDKRGPKIDGWPDTNAFSLVTRPSTLRGVTVEGTNAVVAIEFGTNLLAKIAFDRNVRPVWATTNGVSIGPIPTNTVRLIEVLKDGNRRMKVIY